MFFQISILSYIKTILIIKKLKSFFPLGKNQASTIFKVLQGIKWSVHFFKRERVSGQYKSPTVSYKR